MKKENTALKKEIKKLKNMIEKRAPVNVLDITMECSCKYSIWDKRTGQELSSEEKEHGNIFSVPVYKLDIHAGKIRIWICRLGSDKEHFVKDNNADMKEADQKYNDILDLIFRKIRTEYNRLSNSIDYPSTYNRRSPFEVHNPEFVYENDTFKMRSNTYGDCYLNEGYDMTHANFAWGPVRAFWERNSLTNLHVYVVPGYDTADIYIRMFNDCLSAMERDFAKKKRRYGSRKGTKKRTDRRICRRA